MLKFLLVCIMIFAPVYAAVARAALRLRRREGDPGRGSEATVLLSLAVSFLLTLAILSLSPDSGGEGGAVRAHCRNCGRSFVAGDAGGNYESIARTRLCSDCCDSFRRADRLAPQ